MSGVGCVRPERDVEFHLLIQTSKQMKLPHQEAEKLKFFGTSLKNEGYEEWVFKSRDLKTHSSSSWSSKTSVFEDHDGPVAQLVRALL